MVGTYNFTWMILVLKDDYKDERWEKIYFFSIVTESFMILFIIFTNIVQH